MTQVSDRDSTVNLEDNPHDRALPPSILTPLQQRLALVLFVIGFVLSGVFSLTEHWRRATFMLGLSLAWLAVVRARCDSRILGVLSVRSRKFDVLFCSGLGAVMMFLAASVDALGS